jgi:hypothetical protein
LAGLLRDTFIAAGFSKDAVRWRSGIEVPGYYRPKKKWDLVVLDQGRLVAAIELASHIGPSVTNNLDDWAERALGNAMDVWRAYGEGTFGSIRPWLGFVLLLEESDESTRKRTSARGSCRIDPIFDDTSAKDRYGVLCRRLVRGRLYDAACFVTSSRDPDEPIHQPNPELGFANFIAAIAGRAAYIKALDA